MKKIVSVCLAGILLLCYSIYVFDARNPESMSGQRGGGTAGFTYLKKTPIYYGSESNVYCGLHPDADHWQRVPSYSFTMSQTVDMDVAVTYNGESLGGQIAVSAGSPYGGGFTIDVDQMRDSRLEVFCDYDYVVYRAEVRECNTDQVYQTFQYADFFLTAERFIPYYG